MQVNDLRSALRLLETMPGQLVQTEVPVDPMAELAGVYRYVGAGGTVQRPPREGPAMIFRNVKGHPGAQVAIGVLASRKACGGDVGVRSQGFGKTALAGGLTPCSAGVGGGSRTLSRGKSSGDRS